MSAVPAVKTDPMADFQAKLRERVREDIRDLLPEAAVAALVQKAINDEFFTERTIEDGSGWNSRTRKAPSLFVEEVVRAAKPIMDAVVKQYIADHPDCVEKVIKDFLDENKLAAATAARLTDMLSSCVMSLQETLRR